MSRDQQIAELARKVQQGTLRVAEICAEQQSRLDRYHAALLAIVVCGNSVAIELAKLALEEEDRDRSSR